MQFNFVVSTNTRAVRLWQGLGFAIVGTLPKAFQHRDLGYVDAYVMHRSLDDLSGGREAAFPLFGGREDDDPYAVRPCAYAIVVNEHGQIAVVRSGEGVFLPGGGMDAEESPEQAAVRETLEECAIDIRVTSLVGRAAHIVLAGNAAARVEKRSTFFAAVRVSSLDRAPEHEVSWLAPAEATAEITRTVHAWAVQRWLDLGRGGCPA
jgi:8-oxo-dGTP pyrophosphatase MutT (NUDIX family)